MARGTGKWGRAAELGINSTTPQIVEQGKEHLEIMTTVLHVLPSQIESKIIDLFTIDASKEEKGIKETKPFIHQIRLHGPQGEIVQVWANIDDGAMKEVMSVAMFRKVKHRLGNLLLSSQLLRVANGMVVKLDARWKGKVEVMLQFSFIVPF